MSGRPTARPDGGFALVAALLLVAVVGIVTAVVLQTTSTEVRISGNHKLAVQAFYAAEAGLAEARVRLRKGPGDGGSVIDDVDGGVDSWSDPAWTFALETADDRLPYRVTIRHKTECDAKRAGHTSETPHYRDLDDSAADPCRAKQNNVVYFGYPSPTDTAPVAFTTDGRTPYLPVEKVIAHGGLTGGVTLEEELVHPPGPPQLAAVYAAGNVSLKGASIDINGRDDCETAYDLPPVVAGGAVESASHRHFGGNPPLPQFPVFALAIEAALAELGQGVAVLPTEGEGILLVDGDMTLNRALTWNGMLLVTGTLTLGGGSRLEVHGGLWAGTIDQQAGALTVRYDSCRLRDALLTLPVRVRTWKEVF